MQITSKFNSANLMLRPLFDGPDSLGDFSDGASDIDILNEGDDDIDDEGDSSDTGDDTDNDDDSGLDTDNESGDAGDKSKDTPPKKKDDESEEENADEDEAESTDQEEVETTNGRTTVKAIKAKFPDFFKTFPDLRDAFFREREFSKHFGSVEDAADAAEKAQNFEQFSTAVESGDTGTILDAVLELGESSAVKFAENFLPALLERSPKLTAKVTRPFVEKAIRMVFEAGNDSSPEGKNLKLAARYVAKHLFGEDDPSKFGSERQEPNPERERFEKERRDFAQKQFSTATRDVEKVLDTRISKDVSKAVDPNGTMNEFMRDALIEKVNKEVQKVLAADKAHIARMTSLWRKATKDGYSSEAKSRIISAYLTRAKQSLPSVISKVKAQGKVAKKTTPEDKGVPNRSGSGRNTAPSGRVDYRRSSDLDILNGTEKYVGKK